jgi:hypothetical protein
MKQIKKTSAYAHAPAGKSRLDKAGLCNLLSSTLPYELMTIKQIKKTLAYAEAPVGKSKLNKAGLCALLYSDPIEKRKRVKSLLSQNFDPGELNNIHEIITSDNLYVDLRELPMNSTTFVNFPKGLGGGLTVKGEKYQPTGKKLSWINIKGTEQQVGVWTIKISHTGGKTPIKIFVRGYKDLLDMASALQDGKVTRTDFEKLMCFLLITAREAGGTLINENLDIRVLHFKCTKSI